MSPFVCSAVRNRFNGKTKQNPNERTIGKNKKKIENHHRQQIDKKTLQENHDKTLEVNKIAISRTCVIIPLGRR